MRQAVWSWLASDPTVEIYGRKEPDVNLLFVLAALIGLPALSQVGRALLSLLAGIIGAAFVMALAIVVLLAVATHGAIP